MKHSYMSEYRNVRLKPLAAEDIELLRNWRNDAGNSKYLRKIPHITSEMQKAWFEKYLENEDEICFSIFEQDVLNRVVGSLSLYDFQGKQAEFGKILIGDEAAHGKKIGLHALLAVLKVAFEDLKLEKVILHVYEDNVAARHIYETAGFVKKDSHISCGMTENYMEITPEAYSEKCKEMKACKS